MIRKLEEAIKSSNNIVFFTGAGISTDSGIPDFRSSTGLYKNVYRAEEMLSHSFFMANPKEFYEFYKTKMIYEDAKPNYGHIFMKEVEDLGKNVTVVTQNIDGLHQSAGSKNVLELHGSVLRNNCMKCGKFYDLKDIMMKKDVPMCECGGIIKPDVVLYEEPLNQDTIEKTIEAIAKADLLIVCGTSLNVYPAASFLMYFRGNTLAIINKDSTPKDEIADIIIHDSISNVFKQMKL